MNARKGAFLALTCILMGGISNATADELLDLHTRDLAETKTVSGITVVFDPGKISMVYTLPPVVGIVTQPKRFNNEHSRAFRRTAGSRRNSRRPIGAFESETVLHIADITGRDSRMGEGFFGIIFSRYRALGPHSCRSEKRRERRRPGDLREGKRDNHQRRYQRYPASKQISMKRPPGVGRRTS